MKDFFAYVFTAGMGGCIAIWFDRMVTRSRRKQFIDARPDIPAQCTDAVDLRHLGNTHAPIHREPDPTPAPPPINPYAPEDRGSLVRRMESAEQNIFDHERKIGETIQRLEALQKQVGDCERRNEIVGVPL